MKLKHAAKRVPCVAGKKATMPSVEVITKDVLVPVTKTVFTKRNNTSRSKRNVKLVKPCRSNDNIGPLLKRPSNGPVKTCDKIEQSDGRWNRGKRKKSKESLRKTGKSSKFRANDHVERVRRQAMNQKRQNVELPFPCPISALPKASVTKTSFSMGDSTRKNDKANVERKANTRERVVPKKRRNVAAIRSLDRDSLKSSVVRNWNVPITSSIITTGSTSNDIAAGYCLIPYRDSTSSKIDVIGKRALSTSVVGPAIEPPRALELSTSANVLESHDRTALQLSAQSIRRFSGDVVDSLTFKLLAGDPTRCYQKTRFSETGLPCKIKYSWQVIGRASQTSRTLLESFIETANEPSQPCRVKYSWQIIGIATQTCERDFTVGERRSLAPFSVAKSPRNREATQTDSAQPSTVMRNGKRYIILNNQCTQTFAHKANQSNFAEMHATYH